MMPGSNSSVGEWYHPPMKSMEITLFPHYPLAFARYYLLLNVRNYFLPYLEKFDSYNLLQNSVPGSVQDWFDYTTPNVSAVSATFQGLLFYIYPSIFMVLNIFFIGCFLWLFTTGKLNTLDPTFKRSLEFVACFILLNFAFSVFATPVVLRYQILPMTLLFSFSCLCFNLNTSSKGISHKKW